MIIKCMCQLNHSTHLLLTETSTRTKVIAITEYEYDPTQTSAHCMILTVTCALDKEDSPNVCCSLGLSSEQSKRQGDGTDRLTQA